MNDDSTLNEIFLNYVVHGKHGTLQKTSSNLNLILKFYKFGKYMCNQFKNFNQMFSNFKMI